MRFSGAAPIDGNDIVTEPDAEKRPILLDAKRRPLQARVSPIYGVGLGVVVSVGEGVIVGVSKLVGIGVKLM